MATDVEFTYAEAIRTMGVTPERLDKMIAGNGSTESGVSGDPTRATAELGKAQLDIKINNALAQIRGSMANRGGDAR